MKRTIGTALASATIALFATPSHANIFDDIFGHRPAHVSRNQVAHKLGSGALVAVASRYLGSGKFTRYNGPWCRDGLNVWLRKAGYYTDGDRRARAVASITRPIASPVPGAIAWQSHHTAVVASVSGHTVKLISANYGHRVRVETASINAYRYGMPIPARLASR